MMLNEASYREHAYIHVNRRIISTSFDLLPTLRFSVL